MKKITKKKTGAVRPIRSKPLRQLADGRRHSEGGRTSNGVKLRKPRKLSLAKSGRTLKIDFSTRGERSRTTKPVLFAVSTIDLRRLDDSRRPIVQLSFWPTSEQFKSFSAHVLNLQKLLPRGRNFAREFSVARAGLILTLTVGLNLFGFLSIGNTVAFYNDTESSNGNIFVAGSLDFTVDVEKPDNRFQTYTQGGWGSTAHGHNPGVYRDLHFASAFPGGALIGEASGFTALFTDAHAVEVFLPAGGTPGALGADYVDPTSTGAGVLAGQVLALTLNVGFDLYDVNFAPSVDNLNDYVINDSSVPCDGMTVQEVLDEANTILGDLPSSFSASEINECAMWVNEEFDEGGEDGLVPGGSITQFATILNEGTLGFQYTVEVEKTGGDEDFCNVLNLEAVLEGTTNYTGDLMTFVSSPVVYSSSTDEWEFIISLPIDADVEGSCSFDFVFSGWQTTLPNFGGFSDIERVDDPVHSVASVTVESEDGNGGIDSGDESSVQELGLDNESKVEDAVTGEDADDTGNPDGDGGNDGGVAPADESSNEEAIADDAAGDGGAADENADDTNILGDSSGDGGEAEEDGVLENDSSSGGAVEPDGSIEPLPSDPLPPAIDPTADSSLDPVPSTPEPSPPLEPSGEGPIGEQSPNGASPTGQAEPAS